MTDAAIALDFGRRLRRRLNTSRSNLPAQSIRSFQPSNKKPCSDVFSPNKAKSIPVVISFRSQLLGQGSAELRSALSSGKLNAPSIALELSPIWNHCSNASV